MPGPSHAPVALLASAVESLTGRPVEKVEMIRFRQYLELLLTWNRTHRLTGSKSASSIVRELFLDSLLFVSQLPAGPLSMVDIGTGPGIPGVPLHIIRPEISLTLIESRRKHVSFLATLKRELGLTDLRILEGRAETLLTDRHGLARGFDVAVSRAVGRSLLPTVTGYLKPGGLIVMGGPPLAPSAKDGKSPEEDSSALTEEEKQIRWARVTLQRLGVSRTFLVGTKSG